MDFAFSISVNANEKWKQLLLDEIDVQIAELQQKASTRNSREDIARNIIVKYAESIVKEFETTYTVPELRKDYSGITYVFSADKSPKVVEVTYNGIKLGSDFSCSGDTSEIFDGMFGSHYNSKTAHHQRLSGQHPPGKIDHVYRIMNSKSPPKNLFNWTNAGKIAQTEMFFDEVFADDIPARIFSRVEVLSQKSIHAKIRERITSNVNRNIRSFKDYLRVDVIKGGVDPKTRLQEFHRFVLTLIDLDIEFDTTDFDDCDKQTKNIQAEINYLLEKRLRVSTIRFGETRTQ